MARKIYINNNNLFQIKKAYFNNNSSINTLSKRYANLSGSVFQFFPSYTWLKYSINQYWVQVQHLIDTSPSSTFSMRMNIAESQIGQTLGLKTYSRKNTGYNEVILDTSTRLFSRQNYGLSSIKENFTITQSYERGLFWYFEDIFYGTRNLFLLSLIGNSLWNLGSKMTEYYGWDFNEGEHHWCFAYDSLNQYNNILTIYRSDKKQEKGSLIGTVESSSSDTYPENGIGADGYWYVRQT